MENKEQNTRQRLIDATFEEVYEKGFQGASLNDILKKAEAHKGSMYHYFANKKEMTICAVYEVLSQRFSIVYKSILDSEPPLLEKLFSVLRNKSIRDFKRGCPLANLVQETSNLDEDFKQTLQGLYDDLKDGIDKILTKAIAYNELKPCDTKKLSLFIVASIEGAILSAKASGNEQDYLDCIEILISLIKSYA